MTNPTKVGMIPRPNSIPIEPLRVYFMTPELKDLFAELSVNVIDTGAYDAVRRCCSPSDLAFSFAIDQIVRDHYLFVDVADNLSFAVDFGGTAVEYQGEHQNLLNPLVNSQEFQQEVIAYLNGSGNQVTPAPIDTDLGYETFSRGNTLFIGVKQGFFNQFREKNTAVDFYRNCLESCQNAVQGESLRYSALFAKFVKHSISF